MSYSKALFARLKGKGGEERVLEKMNEQVEKIKEIGRVER